MTHENSPRHEIAEEFNVTQREHKLLTAHKSRVLAAEAQLITIEAVAETIVLVSTSDAFSGNDGIAQSLSFMGGTLMAECQSLRKKLYEA